jgi:hypothetical protein
MQAQAVLDLLQPVLQHIAVDFLSRRFIELNIEGAVNSTKKTADTSDRVIRVSGESFIFFKNPKYLDFQNPSSKINSPYYCREINFKILWLYNFLVNFPDCIRSEDALFSSSLFILHTFELFSYFFLLFSFLLVLLSE